jgi:hypothetical protein
MNFEALPLIDRIVTFSWYYVRKYFGHTYPKLFDKQDEGFEDQFREFVFRELKAITVSETHDLGFGKSLESLSGLTHEIDLIAKWDGLLVVFELKNCTVDKTMVLNFQQKCLDYFLQNEHMLKENCLEKVFLTSSTVTDMRIRNFCIIWGIRLIDFSQTPLGQCKLWLEMLSSHPNVSEKHKDLFEYLVGEIQYLEDNMHTDMNHIFRRKDELTFEMSPNISAPGNDLITKQSEISTILKSLMKGTIA